MIKCLSEKNIRAGLGTAAKYKDENILIIMMLLFSTLKIITARVTITTMMMTVMLI